MEWWGLWPVGESTLKVTLRMAPVDCHWLSLQVWCCQIQFLVNPKIQIIFYKEKSLSFEMLGDCFISQIYLQADSALWVTLYNLLVRWLLPRHPIVRKES